MVLVIGASSLDRAIKVAKHPIQKRLAGKYYSDSGVGFHPKNRNPLQTLQKLLVRGIRAILSSGTTILVLSSTLIIATTTNRAQLKNSSKSSSHSNIESVQFCTPVEEELQGFLTDY